jgi:hypothetical protein
MTLVKILSKPLSCKQIIIVSFFALSLVVIGMVCYYLLSAKKEKAPQMTILSETKQSVSGPGLPSPQNPYYGYLTFSPISSLPLNDLKTHINSITIRQNDKAGTPTDADLQALRGTNIKVIFKLDNEIAEIPFFDTGSVNTDALAKLKARLDNYKDVIDTIYVVDEPYKVKKKYTEQQVHDLVQQVKEIFPGYLMQVNFLHPAEVNAQYGGSYPGNILHPRVPDNVDVISFDTYLKPLIEAEQYYKSQITKDVGVLRSVSNGQPIFFVSLASRTDENKDGQPDSRPELYQVDWSYEIFVEQKLAGLVWYFYDDKNGQNWYGTSHWPDLIAKHREIGNKIIKPTTSTESATPIPTTVVTGEAYPIVFAIESQTADRYPDIKNQIASALDNVNSRLQEAGIQGYWKILRFADNYDKTIQTSCIPSFETNRQNGYLPAEYCNHPKDYVFVIVDETNVRKVFNWDDEKYPSLEWHGSRLEGGSEWQKLFSDTGVSILAHELSHMLGLPDLYHMRISSSANKVNGEAFPGVYNPWNDNIMSNVGNSAPNGQTTWNKEIITQTPELFPMECLWHTAIPQDTIIQVNNQIGQPLTQADISVYLSDNNNLGIDAVAEWTGETDTKGQFHLGAKPFGTVYCAKPGRGTIRLFLVKISQGGKVDYQWFNFMDVNFAYWENSNIINFTSN